MFKLLIEDLSYFSPKDVSSSFMTKQYIECQIIFSSTSASILSQCAVLRIESPPWKCLFALLRIPEMSLPAGLHPVRWTVSAGGEEGVASVAYDILWYHNASPVLAQICFAFDVSRNTVTGIRILSSLFGRRRNSQRCWSTFRNGRYQRLHSPLTIAKIRLFRHRERQFSIVTWALSK